MYKIVNPCECKVYTRGKEIYKNAFVRIEYKNSRLSICGVVAPLGNGNALGGVGQCIDEIKNGIPTDEWSREMLDKLCDIWEEWHLNDMRPYCSHMKELGWVEQTYEKVKVAKWTLTNEAYNKKAEIEGKALNCLRNGRSFTPTTDEIAYANMKYFITVYNDESLSHEYGKLYANAYELKEKDCLGSSNIEYKTRGWIPYKDNKLGFLGKPCPICGYKYGTSWKSEEVPKDVLKWLENLPKTKVRPAWV